MQLNIKQCKYNMKLYSCEAKMGYYPSIFAFSIAPTRVAYEWYDLFIWSYVIIKILLHEAQ